MLRAARPAEDCAVRHEQGRAPAGYRFPETSWGIVLATRASADAGRALEVLCRRYWPPVYASLRRKGFEPATAEDLTQGFFLHLIEHGIVARADPRRGRFRSFLFGALRWFLANDRERLRALKRGGDSVFVPMAVARMTPGDLGFSSAFVWRPGRRMADLNSLVIAGSNMHIEFATGINDRGEIAANAYLPTGEIHGILLVPVTK
jgi:hypothetical protein